MKLKMDNLRQALHKCCYPHCVGQPDKSWVWSPYGFNILVSFLKSGTVKTDQTNKYVQMNKILSKKQTWQTRNKLFHTPICKMEELVQNLTDVSLEIEKLDFKSTAAKDSINKWNVNFNTFDIGSNFPPDTNFVLVNITTFQDRWKISESSGFRVKVFNSFNYTQDVKYEARFLQVPMLDEDFQLVIVVPNEMDQLQTLFRRLSNEGLTAALASVQPLFTINTKLSAPRIAINSETEIHLMDDNRPMFSGSSVQYGTVKIDDTGASVKVLTCLSSNKPPSHTACVKDSFKEDKIYFFALIFKDIPLITGQYLFESNSTSIL